MKRSYSMLFIFAIVAYMTPLCAIAADNNYVTLKPGVYSPQSRSLKHFDNGFAGEIVFGHQYNPYFAVEAGIGYFRTEGKFRTSDRISGESQPFRERDRFDVVPLTLSAKVIRPAGKWEFFGTGGVGAYIISEDITVRGNVGSWSGRASFDDTDTVFGFHLGLGFQYNITSKLFVGTEGKYLWVRQARLRDTAPGTPVFMDSKPRMDGIQGTATIGFRF